MDYDRYAALLINQQLKKRALTRNLSEKNLLTLDFYPILMRGDKVKSIQLGLKYTDDVYVSEDADCKKSLALPKLKTVTKDDFSVKFQIWFDNQTNFANIKAIGVCIDLDKDEEENRKNFNAQLTALLEKNYKGKIVVFLDTKNKIDTFNTKKLLEKYNGYLKLIDKDLDVKIAVTSAKEDQGVTEGFEAMHPGGYNRTVEDICAENTKLESLLKPSPYKRLLMIGEPIIAKGIIMQYVDRCPLPDDELKRLSIDFKKKSFIGTDFNINSQISYDNPKIRDRSSLKGADMIGICINFDKEIKENIEVVTEKLNQLRSTSYQGKITIFCNKSNNADRNFKAFKEQVNTFLNDINNDINNDRQFKLDIKNISIEEVSYQCNRNIQSVFDNIYQGFCQEYKKPVEISPDVEALSKLVAECEMECIRLFHKKKIPIASLNNKYSCDDQIQNYNKVVELKALIDAYTKSSADEIALECVRFIKTNRNFFKTGLTIKIWDWAAELIFTKLLIFRKHYIKNFIWENYKDNNPEASKSINKGKQLLSKEENLSKRKLSLEEENLTGRKLS